MTFNTKGLMSSHYQKWKTPKWLYEKLNKEFNFDFDPCPENPTEDGLLIEWGERNFVNPPYKYNKLWLKKGVEQWLKGKLVVFLLPARTDTKYFHEYIYNKAELRFIKGRLKFNDGNGSAPFPSMLCIFK